MIRAHKLIFDGRHLLWRTSDVFKMLSVDLDGKDVGVGGVYGFLSVALRIYQRYGGEVIVAWEGSNNFRYKLYPEYKKKEAPDHDREQLLLDMASQEVRLKALLRAMGVKQYAAVGCEADDVMGRLAKDHAQTGKRVVIYTGDSDLRQCVNTMVTVVAPGRKGKDTVYDHNAVREKHLVPPYMLADLKALAGDSSDNIPGIPGIGPVTASKLIDEYGTVENIVKAAKGSDEDWKGAPRFKPTISESSEELAVYKELTTIRTTAGMKLIEPKRNQKKVVNQLMMYRFASLMHELGNLMRMANGK